MIIFTVEKQNLVKVVKGDILKQKALKLLIDTMTSDEGQFNMAPF